MRGPANAPTDAAQPSRERRWRPRPSFFSGLPLIWARRGVCFQALAAIVAATATRPARADGEGWQITPSIALQEVFNSNTQASQANPAADVVTQIIPGVTIIGETPYTNLNFTYAPVYNHYNFGTSPDEIDQNLTGKGLLTPIPNYLTIDLTANATESGASGNLGNGQNSVLIPTNNLLLYYVGGVAPHFQTHFDNAATLDAYYRVTSTNTSDQSPQIGPGPSLSFDVLEEDAEIIVGSGNNFGPLNAKLDLDDTQSSGSGQNSVSHTDTDVINLEYHLSHTYSLLGSVGYQKINYPTFGSTIGYNSEGLTWSAGLHAAPTEASSLAVSYGFSQGSYTPTVQMNYALGGRTTVSATYTATVENELQASTQNLQYLTYNANGAPIDSRTGLPFSAVNQTFGSQNALFRDMPALLSVTHQFVRSALTATATYEVRQSVSGLAALDKAWGGGITYSRVMTPLLQASADLGYTDHRTSGDISSGAEHARVITADVSLVYTISQSTVASLTESYFRRISNIPINSATTSQLIVGLKRSF